MNNLKQFIDLPKICPVCNKSLTVYLQLVDNSAYQLIDLFNNRAVFLSSKNQKIIYDFDSHNFYFEDYEKNDLMKIAMKYDMYMFFICNKEAVSDSDEISVYDSCSYKASDFYRIVKENDKYCLDSVSDSPEVIKTEVFCISKDLELKQDVYIYSSKFDSNNSKHKFYHYSVDKSKSEDELYSPNVLEKDFNNLSIDLSDKDKLIERFEQWVTLI